MVRKQQKSRKSFDPKLEPLENRRLMAADVDQLLTHQILDAPEIDNSPHTQDQLTGEQAEQVAFAHDTLGLTGLGQTVVIIDSGIAYDHAALGGGYGDGYRVVGGWDFAENDADPYDDAPRGFHGTHVAGIVGSSDASYTGVAPGVDLVSLRVFDDNGSGSFAWIEDAIDWVHDNKDSFDNPITTVNISIGVDYNNSNNPYWATLEAELAQLEDDGIFVSVAAGNYFQSYQSPGLSYPATSPHVVPVSSIGTNGQLMSSSQRHSRALAAPGQSVRSTVPDFKGNRNGITDDFKSVSGTSMAAPFVAGASVLVREAWDIAGITNVDQEDIYDHLVATSDTVYDSITDSNYNVVNLERALTEALPTDLVGESIETASDLGMLASSLSADGLLNGAEDSDYFTFTAASTGEVTVSIAGNTHYADAVLSLIGGDQTGDSLTFMVNAGESYTVAVGNEGGVGSYDLNLSHTVTAVAEYIGEVALTDFAHDADGSLYEFTATNSGWLTVSAEGAATGTAEVLSTSGTVLATIDLGAGETSATIDAVAGTNYKLSVNSDAGLNFRFTNLVGVDGSEVTLYGTSAKDRFKVRAGSTTTTIEAAGESYQIATNSVFNVNFANADDTDEVWVIGTAADDHAIFDGDSSTLRSDSYEINVDGVKNISQIANGGNDTAEFFDTAGNDVVAGRNNYSIFAGGGLRHVVSGFSQVDFQGVNGGVDVAVFHDTAGNESATISSDYASLDYNDLGVGVSVAGFDTVHILAFGAGDDRIEFHDSEGSDQLRAYPQYVWLLKNGFQGLARGFTTVDAYSSAGGYDDALIYDSTGDDVLFASPGSVSLAGDDFFFAVHGWDVVGAISSAGGYDTGQIRDSAGSDTFLATSTYTVAQGTNFRQSFYGFDDIDAESSEGGFDRAVIYANTDGQDVLFETDDMTTIVGSAYNNSFESFDNVMVLGQTQTGDPAGQSDPTGQSEFVVTGDPMLKVAFMIDGIDHEASTQIHEGLGADAFVIEHQLEDDDVDSALQSDDLLEDESFTREEAEDHFARLRAIDDVLSLVDGLNGLI